VRPKTQGMGGVLGKKKFKTDGGTESQNSPREGNVDTMDWKRKGKGVTESIIGE